MASSPCPCGAEVSFTFLSWALITFTAQGVAMPRVMPLHNPPRPLQSRLLPLYPTTADRSSSVLPSLSGSQGKTNFSPLSSRASRERPTGRFLSCSSKGRELHPTSEV